MRGGLCDYWTSLCPLLQHPDLPLATLTLDLLNLVTMDTVLETGAGLRTVGSLVALFLRVLQIEGEAFIYQLIYKLCYRLCFS